MSKFRQLLRRRGANGRLQAGTRKHAADEAVPDVFARWRSQEWAVLSAPDGWDDPFDPFAP